jgi:xanthine dehydrogenase accessory factor
MAESDNKALPQNITKAVQRILYEGGLAALATLIESQTNVGAKLIVEQSGAATGSLGASALDKAIALYGLRFLDSREEARAFKIADIAPELAESTHARVLFERIQPEPRLVICGAGHVGAALAKLASFVGYHATLIDDRAEFVTRDRFPDQRINLVATKSWADGVSEAIGNGRGVSVAVVTRGHNEDEECMRAVVSTDADYIGLIGSKRRTNIVLERIRESGVPEGQLERVRAPVGLNIAAVTPEEVALAILAEIVAERRGGKGGSLSAWRRKEQEGK